MYVYIFLQMTTSLCVCIIMVRLNAANFYSSHFRSLLHCDSSICPYFKIFIHSFERYLIFIRCVVFCHNSISNSVIIFDSSRFFADYIFFYLRLFTLTYISPICYVIYWEDHVSSKNQISWYIAFILVVS